MQIRIYHALPSDPYCYLLNIELGDGEFLDPGNWHGWGNRAQFKEGDGWLVKSLDEDTYAKSSPQVKNEWDKYQPLPGHQGVHWVTIKEHNADWRVKIRLGEPLPAGRYSVKISEKPSKYGNNYFSGAIEAFVEPSTPPLTPAAISDAQQIANALNSTAVVQRTEVEPIANLSEAEQKIAELRLKLEQSNTKLAEHLFDRKPTTGRHPDAPDIPGEALVAPRGN